MLLTIALWILIGLCLSLAALYTHASSQLPQIRQLQDKLDRASKELARADARLRDIQLRKGELMSAVAHEIRTPLTCVVGYTQILKDKEFPRDQQLTYLEVILRESRR